MIHENKTTFMKFDIYESFKVWRSKNLVFLCILKLLFKDLMNAHKRTISRVKIMIKFDFL